MSEDKDVKKPIKAINPEDVAEQLDIIVSFLGAIESSREEINKRVKHLKDEYGLQSTAALRRKKNKRSFCSRERQCFDISRLFTD